MIARTFGLPAAPRRRTIRPMRRTLRRRVPLLAALAAILAIAAMPAGAEADDGLRQQRIVEAFGRRDYATAERLLGEALAADPGHPTHLYNLACLHSLRGEAEPAAARLQEAIDAGFREWTILREDPDLAFLRGSPAFTPIRDAIERSERAGTGGRNAAEASLQGWLARFGASRYRVERDERRNLLIATSLGEEPHREMLEGLDRLARHLSEALFGEAPRHPVLLVVARPDDAAAFFGEETTAGLYEHARRRLVTRDIGESLRHEFVHALHHACMERLGQRHPIWVQEGLATLFENYAADADGTFSFRPNSRHNVAYRAARAGVVRPWREVLAASPDRFMAQSTRLYPQVRSMWEFIAAEAGLERFWRIYLDTFPESPDGTLALREAFGEEIDAIDRRWRRWVVERGPIDDAVRPGDASLGLEGEDRPDGVLVRGLLPGSAAAAAGVRRGDLLFEIDGDEIRSTRELLLAIAGRQVGDPVRLAVRRGGDRIVLDATLRPLPRQAGGSAVAPRPRR